MSKTYTFPTQDVLAGTLTFEIKTSTGSGSSAQSEKYFSSNLKLVNETEFLGGDLQSPYVDITIENDESNLFESTILTDCYTELGWVTLKISLGSNIRFYGRVEPSTISIEPYYATSDALSSKKTRVSFKCIWIVSLGKNITKETFAGRLVSTSIDNGRYLAPSGVYLYDGYVYTRTRDMIDAFFYLLNSNYSFTYNISYELTDFHFFSKGDGVELSGAYNFPNVLQPGEIDYGSFGENLEPCLILGKVGSVSGTTGLPTGVLTESGTLFYDSSDTTFNNAYEFFVGILKSFGLYCNITHSSTYDLIVKIGTRISGSEIIPTQILESAEMPFSDISRSGLNITSMQSGNAYTKEFNNLGTSEFTLQVPLDFGNDDDFPGGATPVNSIKSLVYPVGGTYPRFSLVREIGLGNNILTNPSFVTDLSGWTVESGTWVWNTGPGVLVGSGVARVPLNTIIPQELSQTLSVNLYDGIIFGGWVVTNYIGTGQIIVTIKFYQGSTVIATEIKSIATVNRYLLIYGTIRAGVLRQNYGDYINKISVTVQSSGVGSATDFMYLDRMFLYKNRFGTPQLVGLQIEDYFNKGILTRLKEKYNGVRTDIHPRDYFQRDAETYYYKNITENYFDNETEIEAINYQ